VKSKSNTNSKVIYHYLSLDEKNSNVDKLNYNLLYENQKLQSEIIQLHCIVEQSLNNEEG
jgi:uncharacterized protein YfeS